VFVRLIDGGGAEWAPFDATGALAGEPGRGPLASVAGALAGRRCSVLVPAVDVTSALVDLPVASQARLRQIVPFSLEESLADDVEQLAFAIGARRESGATPVAVTAKQRMNAWLEQLRGVGIVPQALFSEADGVPDVPGTLVLLLEGDRIYGRAPDRAPFVLEGLSLRQALDSARGTGEEPQRPHLLVYASAAQADQARRALAATGEEFAGVDVKVAAEGVFAHLAATLAQRAGTNLLQGVYAPKSNLAAYARPWRFAAALLIAALVLSLVAQAAQFFQLRRSDEALGQIVAASCQRAVGDARPSACQREVQQRLGASATGAGGEDFLSTLAAVAAARNASMHIDALSYRNRTMDLQLMAASVPALDEFARGLAQTKRFNAQIEAANQKDSGTEGRIKIVGVNP
jgi:general secretion pathway protein L